MTDAQVLVGAADISAAIKRIDVWQKVLPLGIGTFNVLLNNIGGLYDNAFVNETPVYIKASSVGTLKPLMYGYLDSPTSQVRESPKAKFEKTMLLSGRDYGLDLMNLTVTDVYNDYLTSVITQILANAGSELSNSGLGTPPTIYYDAKGRSYLIDAIKDIFGATDREGYVDSLKSLNYFPIGDVANGIALKCIEEDVTNNIITKLDRIERDVTESKTDIFAFGAKVDDGLTEMCASYWANAYADQVISDYFGISPTPPAKGIAAIKITPTGAFMTVGMKMAFPRYSADIDPYLDFSQVNAGSIAYQEYDVVTSGTVKAQTATIYLTDTNGNQIKNHSGLYTTNAWLLRTMNVGNGVPILSSGSGFNDQWIYVSPATSFNWRIAEIQIDSGLQDVSQTLHYALFDALALPNNLLAYATNYVSGKRKHLLVTRNDILSQIELQGYADQIARKRISQIEHLKLTALGSAGWIASDWKWIPGTYSSVNIPDIGIDTSDYRLITLHHVLEQEENTAWDHVVDLEMVPRAQLIDVQQWSYQNQGPVALIRRLRDELSFMQWRRSFT